MPNPLPPETTPEWTEQDEVDLRDFARFIGPDFTPSAKAAYRFAREIIHLRSENERLRSEFECQVALTNAALASWEPAASVPNTGTALSEEALRCAFLAGVEGAVGAEGCGAQYDAPSREYARRIIARLSSAPSRGSESDVDPEQAACARCALPLVKDQNGRRFCPACEIGGAE